MNKNDPNDARSVAIAALRAHVTAEIVAEDETGDEAMGSPLSRLGQPVDAKGVSFARAACDLVPGGFARRISVLQAIQLLGTIAPRTAADVARLELANDLVTDLTRIQNPAPRDQAAPGQGRRCVEDNSHRRARRRPRRRRDCVRLRR